MKAISVWKKRERQESDAERRRSAQLQTSRFHPLFLFFVNYKATLTFRPESRSVVVSSRKTFSGGVIRGSGAAALGVVVAAAARGRLLMNLHTDRSGLTSAASVRFLL